MIDRETLLRLGWSDELITAAEKVAERIPSGAALKNRVRVIPRVGIGSTKVRVDGPPIASAILRVDK